MADKSSDGWSPAEDARRGLGAAMQYHAAEDELRWELPDFRHGQTIMIRGDRSGRLTLWLKPFHAKKSS